MSLIEKLAACYRPQYFKINLRTIHNSGIFSAKSSTEDVTAKSSTQEIPDVLDDLREPELTEEEILQKRFKSRLPEMVHRRFIQKDIGDLEYKHDFGMKRLRRYYARFGTSSKLNPGICWPTREQILEEIEYSKLLEPSLEERLKTVKEERLAEEKRKQEVEAEVDKNMANLDKWMADYYGKIEKKKAEAEALKKKKEKLIDEICEYLGYEIDPRDPRFQEAVEQREKEQKKARKVKKQQESYDKMISKLKQMAEN